MTAPEPRDDVAVAEVLAEITDPIHAGGCYYRHQQGEVDECNSCTAHRIETRVAEALAPLIAERERAAVERARDESAVAEVGLTDAEWTRLRHAAGNRVVLGPIAEEFERILGERVRAAAVEALREAADEIKAGVLPSHPSSHYRDGFARAAQIVLDRADRRAER